MVEEKKKRGRPKKLVSAGEPVNISVDYKLPNFKEPTLARDFDQKHRRDDLCVQMIMGVINKQGTIKYDFAKDLFNTATQLAYDFGWMVEKKKKPALEEMSPLLDPVYGFGAEEKKSGLSEIITPADAFRAVRGDS